MLRLIALTAAMTVAASASAQSNLVTRTDRVLDTLQLTYQSQSKSTTSLSAASLFLPNNTLPSNTFGYVTTAPTFNAKRTSAVSELYNRTFYGASNILMGYTGTANGHTFRLASAQAGLAGSVQFVVRYNSSGLNQRDVLFTAAPSAQVSGPTANLTAILSSTRIGRFSPPRYSVTGFFLNAAGVNNVNLTTSVGGITFNTGVATTATTFSMPIARLAVPPGRLTVAPQTSTSTEFRASYSLAPQ